MRDLNSGIWARRQNLERVRLEAVVRPAALGNLDQAEPTFSQSLCAMIVGYWRERGYTVRAWTEAVSSNAGTVYVIRTNGIPVRL